MNKVSSYEQYKQEMARVKEQGYKLTNCFFLPSAARQKAEEGTLRFLSVEDGLLLLDDVGSFYRCYYFLSKEARPAPVSLDKPAVIEFPYRSALGHAEQEQISRLQGMGFRLGRESAQMAASAEQIMELEQGGQALEVTAAQAEDGPQLLGLLERSFDPLYAFLPSREKLDCAIEEQRVLVIKNGSTVEAVLNSSVEKNRASIDHVAVAEQSRGKGLGKQIVQAYHRKYRQSVSGFQHWVDLNNRAAVSMYTAFGYAFSVRKANEYVK